MNKKVLIPAIVLGLVATGALAWKSKNALAFWGGSSDGNRDQMVQELATKLNVSQDQVATAMDEIRAEHQAERQAEVSQNLDQAVTDGVITADQKQLILDKMAQDKLSGDETKAERQQYGQEMQQWFSDNGIDGSVLRSYIGHGPRGMGNQQ